MGPNEFILFVALAVTLGAWGVAQLLLDVFDSDSRRLQQRLASDWRKDLEALRKRSIVIQSDVKGVPPWMARVGVVKALNRRLLTAYPSATLGRFLAFSAPGPVVVTLVVWLAMGSLLFTFAAFLGSAYVPLLLLNAKRRKRQQIMGEQLPEALDFLCRILRAGHSLSTGIQMMGDELPQPIAGEFRRCYDQHSFGQPLEDCLRDAALRVESGDFAFFVTAVLIQRNTGGDLSEVLANLAGVVRARIRLQQHVKAITAEGRLTGYVLVAFPVVLFAISYVLNPSYAGVLVTTDTGQTMLGLAIALQCVGLYAIRRIVNVRM